MTRSRLAEMCKSIASPVLLGQQPIAKAETLLSHCNACRECDMGPATEGGGSIFSRGLEDMIALLVKQMSDEMLAKGERTALAGPPGLTAPDLFGPPGLVESDDSASDLMISSAALMLPHLPPPGIWKAPPAVPASDLSLPAMPQVPFGCAPPACPPPSLPSPSELPPVPLGDCEYEAESASITDRARSCEVQDDGSLLFRWNANSLKLASKDQQIKSPELQIDIPGFGAQPFRLLLFPAFKTAIVRQQKGAACFKKAKGNGRAELKCEAALPETVSQLHVQFGVGDPSSGVRSNVEAHNFGHQSTCRWPGVFDFSSVVEKDTRSFPVFVVVSVPQGP